MCLDLADDKVRYQCAISDITVFKMVVTRDYLDEWNVERTNLGLKKLYATPEGIEFFTPYRKSPIDLSVPAKSQLRKNGGIRPTVDRGLHSFKYLADVESIIRQWRKELKNPERENQTRIFTATIPQLAFYYEGQFNTVDSYASDTLIYGELLPITE